MSVQLNVQQFFTRAAAVFSAWSSSKLTEFESLAGLDALQILVGDPVEDEMLRKSTALQTWLLGYEFPLTLVVFSKDKIFFMCSSTKAKILDQLLETQKTPIPIEIFTMSKPKDGPSDAPKRLAEALGPLKRIGGLPKELQKGRIIDDWSKALEEHLGKPEIVDISAGLASIMAVKDEDELKHVRTAAHLSSTLMTHQLASKLELLLDRQSAITHESFAGQLEARLGTEGKEPDLRVWSKNKHLANVDFSSAEFTFPPIIQSRSSGYDLRVNAESTQDQLAHKGVILATISMRYKGYSAHVSRTFFVDPSKEQESVYSFSLSLQSELLSKLRDGTPAKDVYAHAVSYIKQKKPDLEKHFAKNVGFGMGLEYRDSSYLLSPKNTRQVKAGMIFNLSIGFSDLDESDGKKYSILISDTVKVGQEKAVCLTEGTKATDEVMFFFQDDDAKGKHKPDSPSKNKSKPASAKKNASPNGKVVGSKVLRTKTRQQFLENDTSASTLARITAHQKELHSQRLADGLERFADDEGGDGNKERKTWKKFQSYRGDAGLPKEVDSMRIHIDRRNMTIVVPVHGFAVPFHINTVKNVSKLDEGEFTYLRINFQSPGQLTGRKEDTPFEDPDATFIRSLTYRSADGIHFDDLAKQITDMKKEVNKREQEKKALADVVEQADLVEIKGRRPLKLPEVFVRPALDGKRLPGEVEIHSNGIRYLGAMGQKIDILFSNIKHLFFAPCDGEMLVLIHCHLKSPIIIGKRKSKDVQFYREASDVQFDETGNRKRKYRYGDEDEIELEQSERKRRQQLNKEFKHFAEKIAEASGSEGLEVDIPFRELAFEGVPFRTNVKLQPTTDCLVHLFDPPFLVITLSEIEIASLERVQFGLKQFDLIFIFNDFSKTPQHINSIPTPQLDSVKEWLDSVEIPMAEGPVNLNWGQIMKTINDNPLEFFRDGGWSFLGGTAAEGSDKHSSDDSDTESDFAAESEESVASSSDSDESDFDDGSDASEDEGSGSEVDEDESGDDWDTLEKKAAKSDNKARDGGRGHESDDSDRPKKKAPAGKSKAPAKVPAKASGKGGVNGKRR